MYFKFSQVVSKEEAGGDVSSKYDVDVVQESQVEDFCVWSDYHSAL